MSRSAAFLSMLAGSALLMAGLFVWAGRSVSDRRHEAIELSGLTAVLGLTDLSFANDARYTRHPSQADIFSAFQDQPGSIDHFPSGSVTAPPDFSSVGTGISAPGR